MAKKTKVALLRKGGAKPPRRARLYWAYGSNLNYAQMHSRCPEARPFRSLYLENGVLTFRGVADVEYRKGGVIAGGLWWITPRCEQSLDIYEGVGGKVYEKKHMLLEVAGKPERCLYYRMVPSEHEDLGVMPPWDSYLAKITQGYRDFDLNEQLLDEALARAWGEKDKTEDVMRRWRSRGKPRLVRPNVELVEEERT